MCRNAHPKTTQILLTARQTIQPAEPYAAKPKPNITPRAKFRFCAGGSSGPKGPVIDLQIFGEGLGAPPPQVVKGWGLRRGAPTLVLQVVKGRGPPTLVHLQVVKGWGAPNPCPVPKSLIYTDTVAWRPSLATPLGCGRQALQLSRACQGLADARRRPPTHRRGVVGGFGFRV